VKEPQAIRILIADDHPVVREGLSALINRRPDMRVVADASDGPEAVEKFFLHSPDVALIDLRMPRMDGVEVMRAIRNRAPDARLIVLTTFDAEEDVSRALQAGARGYLLKDASLEELLECIRTVYTGKPFRLARPQHGGQNPDDGDRAGVGREGEA
jgi:two-component system NarL family response regulator